MAIGNREDPVRGYNFVITLLDSTSALASVVVSLGIQKPPDAGFSECSGLEMTMKAEEFREGGNNGTVLKFPNRVEWTNLRLRRGVTRSTALWDWHYGFVEGKGKRRDGMIVLQNDLQKPVRAWRFSRGLPVKWTGPSLNAAQNQVAIEELEIAHEGLKVVSASGLGVLGEAVESVAGAVESLF